MLPPPVPWLRRMRCGALQHHLEVLADTFFARWAPQCAVLCAHFVSGRKFSAPHLAGQRPPRCAPPRCPVFGGRGAGPFSTTLGCSRSHFLLAGHHNAQSFRCALPHFTLGGIIIFLVLGHPTKGESRSGKQDTWCGLWAFELLRVHGEA